MRFIPLICLPLILAACEGDTTVIYPVGPSSTLAPSTQPVPTPITLTKIEYRVVGNPLQARIRFSNPRDGINQVVTALPYFVTLTTSEDTIFLSLEATATAYSASTFFPALSVQIFVNDVLFREASDNGASISTLLISGTWRKSNAIR